MWCPCGTAKEPLYLLSKKVSNRDFQHSHFVPVVIKSDVSTSCIPLQISGIISLIRLSAWPILIEIITFCPGFFPSHSKLHIQIITNRYYSVIPFNNFVQSQEPRLSVLKSSQKILLLETHLYSMTSKVVSYNTRYNFM